MRIFTSSACIAQLERTGDMQSILLAIPGGTREEALADTTHSRVVWLLSD
jgi:hypothetical protein